MAKEREIRLGLSLPQFDAQVSFPAFITNFSDNYTSNWATEQPYGFQDVLGIFQGTSRKITVGLKVIPESVTESAKRMAMFNKIVQSLYPAYATVGTNKDGAGGVTVPSSSPIVGIRLANLIQEDDDFLYGWLNGFDLTPNFGEAGVWRIGSVLYPRQWDITFAFNVIHKKRPGFKGGKFDLETKLAGFPAVTGLKAAQTADTMTGGKLDAALSAKLADHKALEVGYKWNDKKTKQPPSKTPQQQVGAVFRGPVFGKFGS